MGNALRTGSSTRSNGQRPQFEEELEQEIITTDLTGFGLQLIDPGTQQKEVSNVALPNLKSSKSSFFLKRNTVEVHPVGTKFDVSFEYDAEDKCSVTFLFGQTHMGLNNGVPSFSKPKCKSDQFDLEVGKNLKFVLNHSKLSKLPNVTLDSCSFTDNRKFVPILMVVKSQVSDLTVYVMSGLKQVLTGEWKIFVTKIRIKVGNFGYQLQEVYGLNESSFGQKKDEEKDERIKYCSICLTNPSNTILLPCRHLCVCSQCSVSLTLHFGTCPMCRAVVTQILHIGKETR